jgi:ABC-type bacteriocin/lantibiotic exporter with double-glycine peptidase domain
MAGGRWVSETKASYTYDVLMQEEEADCGLCCTAMIVNLMGQGKPTSDIMQRQLPKGAYNKSTRDRPGMMPTPLAQMGLVTETHSEGTYIASLGQALASYHIPNTTYSGAGNVSAAVLGATPQRPVIVRVGWRPNNAGHWVVVVRAAGAALFILDPAYGFNINTGTGSYTATWQRGVGAGSAPQAGVVGDFTPHWLQVN